MKIMNETYGRRPRSSRKRIPRSRTRTSRTTPDLEALKEKLRREFEEARRKKKEKEEENKEKTEEASVYEIAARASSIIKGNKLKPVPSPVERDALVEQQEYINEFLRRAARAIGTGVRKMLGMSRPDAPKTEVGRGGKTVIVQDTQSRSAKRAQDYTTPEGEQAGLKGPSGETRTELADKTRRERDAAKKAARDRKEKGVGRDLKIGGNRRKTPPQITSDGTAHEGPSIAEITQEYIKSFLEGVTTGGDPFSTGARMGSFIKRIEVLQAKDRPTKLALGSLKIPHDPYVIKKKAQARRIQGKIIKRAGDKAQIRSLAQAQAKTQTAGGYYHGKAHPESLRGRKAENASTEHEGPFLKERHRRQGQPVGRRGVRSGIKTGKMGSHEPSEPGVRFAAATKETRRAFARSGGDIGMPPVGQDLTSRLGDKTLQQRLEKFKRGKALSHILKRPESGAAAENASTEYEGPSLSEADFASALERLKKKKPALARHRVRTKAYPSGLTPGQKQGWPSQERAYTPEEKEEIQAAIAHLRDNPQLRDRPSDHAMTMRQKRKESSTGTNEAKDDVAPTGGSYSSYEASLIDKIRRLTKKKKKKLRPGVRATKAERRQQSREEGGSGIVIPKKPHATKF